MEFWDSEMMKRFMHSAPVNIFFKDTECRYCFASEICDLVSVGENGSNGVQGVQTRLKRKDRFESK